MMIRHPTIGKGTIYCCNDTNNKWSMLMCFCFVFIYLEKIHLVYYDSFPKENFLYISVAEKTNESTMPATVNVPPTIAQT